MAKVKPFKALRFSDKAGDIASLVCPPYDIVSDVQRQCLLAKSKYNLISLELPRGENPYRDAAQLMSSLESEGILNLDQNEGIYIYEEKFNIDGKDYSFKGFVCLVRLYEFSEGVVLPHEFTLSKAKQDRFNLMTETGCSFSQIYSLYLDPQKLVTDKIDALSSGAPEISFTDDEGVVHNLWSIYDKEEIEFISKNMADKRLYIADGHHRYETALNFAKANSKDLSDDSERTNYCMMFLSDLECDGLVVFPTHRIVHSLEQFDAAEILLKCRDYFEIKEEICISEIKQNLDYAFKNGEKAFAFYSGGDSFSLLTLKDSAIMKKLLPDLSTASQNLDVSILHSLILERLFGIDKENMANGKNLTYTRSASEAIEAVKGGEANCCFIINPTQVSEIRDVASAGEKMPQKSTYFYPKLITGLVMNKFREPKPD